MNIVVYNKDKHYDMLCEWWKAHSWTAPAPGFLSDTGIIIQNNDGKCLLAGWIYETNSAIALLEFIVANPDYSKEERDGAFSALMETAEKYLKSRNFSAIFISTENKALMRRLEKYNFKKTDQNVCNFIRSL